MILPFDEYKFTFKEGDERQQYYRLLNEAKAVKILPRMASDEESYFEAGKQLVDTVDFLVAVWDGKPARGLGGTADIVKYARQCHKR
ncbi:MAG: hypothetical protein HC773_18405 [Scytonema sp. CRU_2_7]|nr:hypothetical protein [Scytonema sp. CRU_2_7]